MERNRLSWSIKQGSTNLKILYEGKEIMSLYLGEAIETAGREVVTKIIEEIERTPWIKAWHEKE